MAEEARAVASAIIIPEPAEASAPASKAPEPEPHQSLKRRQSESSETESKRRRLSTDDSVPPTRLPPQDDRRDVRRKSGQVEERKRGQRLFGGLLNTLSQGTSNPAQKRRAEIEKRQHEKLRLQQEEDSHRRKERLEALRVIRKREQKKIDEKTMRIRHATMLHQANHLPTNTKPRLYYKPWDPLPDQEDQIRRQIEETQEIIERELREFEAKRADEDEDMAEPDQTKGQHADAAKSNAVDTGLTHEATDTQPHHIDESANIAESTDEPEKAEADEYVANAVAVQQSVEEQMKDTADENQGEMVVEADEDTVIY